MSPAASLTSATTRSPLLDTANQSFGFPARCAIGTGEPSAPVDASSRCAVSASFLLRKSTPPPYANSGVPRVNGAMTCETWPSTEDRRNSTLFVFSNAA